MTRPFRFRPFLTPDRLTAILLSFAPLLYFSTGLSHSLVLTPDDGLIFNVPIRTVAAQMLRSGFLPLWNPYIFSGMPLHASVQAGLLFPLNWWFLIFSAPTAGNLMVLSTYSLAGLGAYLYARRTGNSISGAIVTSLIWQFSGVLVGQISHINIVQNAAMLPWILWSVEGFAITGLRRWRLLIAILISLQVFAGHPQTFVYSLLLVLAYVIVMARKQPEVRRRYLSSLALITAGVLLAAVQILPTFELLRNSVRSDASYDFFTSFSLPGRYAETFLAPYIMGGGDGRLFRAPYIGVPFYGEMIAYAGLLSIMLSIIALIFKRDMRTMFWTVVVLVAFVFALGDYAPFHLYRLIYHVPILNLFRVPARHLLEVEFALAVLAGRGLTGLAEVQLGKRDRFKIILSSVVIFLATCAAVTMGRPQDFRLGRSAPVTILRAPELFLPIVFAFLSTAALFFYVRSKRTSTLIGLISVLVLDLVIWGQFSGWSLSPRRDAESWGVPKSVAALRDLAPADTSVFRILTTPHTFDPAIAPVPPSISHSPDWNLWTQPDLYMAHGIQNAAGYDGFGLERYSHLAGEMKVWGELTDPNNALRGEAREFDILNVRYLISMRKQSGVQATTATSKVYASATQKYGQWMFGASDLGLPLLKRGSRFDFNIPPVMADQVALVTNLSWSETLADGTTVARLRINTTAGRVIEYLLRAGIDTSEWAHDRADIRAQIKHKLATVASSYDVVDSKGKYEAHTYVTAFSLPEPISVTGGELILEPSAKAPDLNVQLFRLSFSDSRNGKTYPLKREWIVEKTEDKTEQQKTNGESSTRWQFLAETPDVQIYENKQALPRAWLATDARVLDELQTLATIRTGHLPDGSVWDPRRTALVENGVGVTASQPTPNKVEVVRYEPNRIDLKTRSESAALLVLSENHYSGWRAYIDGTNAEVMRVDYNLRGVSLPAGAHDVSFVYRPKSVMLGFGISLLTIVGLIVWTRK